MYWFNVADLSGLLSIILHPGRILLIERYLSIGLTEIKKLLGDHYYQRSKNLARMDPFENPRGGTCPLGPPTKYVYASMGGKWYQVRLVRGSTGFHLLRNM